MIKKFYCTLQKLTPQHGLSVLLGKLANSKRSWLKDLMIRHFMRIYNVNLNEAIIEDPSQYESFNQFFIRQLKPTLRPIIAGDDKIASPCDGTVAQLGVIEENLLLQAKNHYFDLESLFANELDAAKDFYHGHFMTLYLAPHNYHRVHMPVDGKLLKTIYVPGRLFSVNTTTSEYIPGLYSSNERLICLFETAAGKMVLIFVGAMIVGSIKTQWMSEAKRHNAIINEDFSLFIQKGDEVGYFKLGSTVILLFEKNKITFDAAIKAQSTIKMGQLIGELNTTFS